MKGGIQIGDDFLEKTPFLQSKFGQSQLGVITDIKITPESQTCTIAGSIGALTTNLSGDVQSAVTLTARLTESC